MLICRFCHCSVKLACRFFFFFSSRRRHTRCSRDWSSDVCSSDLSYARFPDAMQPFVKALPLTALNDALRAVMIDGSRLSELGAPLGIVTAWGVEIGRASCRERV